MRWEKWDMYELENFSRFFSFAFCSYKVRDIKVYVFIFHVTCDIYWSIKEKGIYIHIYVGTKKVEVIFLRTDQRKRSNSFSESVISTKINISQIFIGNFVIRVFTSGLGKCRKIQTIESIWKPYREIAFSQEELLVIEKLCAIRIFNVTKYTRDLCYPSFCYT